MGARYVDLDSASEKRTILYVRSETEADADVEEHVLGEEVLDGGNHVGRCVCLVDDEGINRRTNALFEEASKTRAVACVM